MAGSAVEILACTAPTMTFAMLPGRMVEIVPPPPALQRSGSAGGRLVHVGFGGRGPVNLFLSCSDRCYSERTDTLLAGCSSGC